MNQTLQPAVTPHAAEEPLTLDTAMLLSRAALLAILTRRLDDAELMIAALKPAFGEQAAVIMLQGSLAIARGRHRDALAIVEALVSVLPEHPAVRCAHALVKKELGIDGWQPIAESLLASNLDEQATKVASDLLADAPRRRGRAAAMTLESAGMRFA